MFYYQEFRSRWEKTKSLLKKVDEECGNYKLSILIENLEELFPQILDYAERKPKKREKFYLRLLKELCDTFPRLEWGEDEDDDFERTIYMWSYDDEVSYDSDISRSGYTSYEELAKDILLHLKIEK